MLIRRQSGTFEFEKDPFSKNVQGVGKIYQEVWLLMNFLQTKPQFKIMIIKYYDLYYTVIKKRDDKEIVLDKYEKIFKFFNDYSTPNHYIGGKNDNATL